MATTLHEPPQIDSRRLPDQGRSGNGGWKTPPGGDLRVAEKYSPPPSSTAIWVVLFAITMMFAAFTSALVVRKGSSLDWQAFNLPAILYFNTLLLLASSVTLEVARRRVSAFMGGLTSQVESPSRWLYVTLFLGLLFVSGQYAAWL
jgi:cytochrome c oxidase subunit III